MSVKSLRRERLLVNLLEALVQNCFVLCRKLVFSDRALVFCTLDSLALDSFGDQILDGGLSGMVFNLEC